MSTSVLHCGQLGGVQLREIQERAALLRRGLRPRLEGSVVALCAEPAPYVISALDAGARAIGLDVSVLGPADVAAIGKARVAGARLGAMHVALVAVGLAPEDVAVLAEASPAPVLEGGGVGGDPVGALADVWTLERTLGGLTGRRLTWVGDSSGLQHDLLIAGCTRGLTVAVAHPMGFAPDAEKVTLARERAASAGGAVLVTTELEEALLETDAVYVEPWPADHGDRFRPYAIQRHSLRHAHASVQVLHRFPERRGPELSASLAEEGGWLAMEQSRARADAFGALLWSMLRPDTMLSVIR